MTQHAQWALGVAFKGYIQSNDIITKFKHRLSAWRTSCLVCFYRLHRCCNTVFSLTESNGLGNITIKDIDSQNNTSGNVQADGRVKVQFHQHAQSVVSWFKGCQSRAVPTEPFKKRSCNTVSLNSQQLVTTPRLNIAIHIIGSRGDVQPFITVAQALSRPPYSHRVRICTHPVFKHFIESQGIEFFSVGGDPEALMSYMVKNPGLLPSRKSVKAGEIKKRRKEMWEILIGAWRSCVEAGDGMGDRVMAANVRETKDLFIADAIIANPPSMAHIHCAAYGVYYALVID